MDTTLRTNCTIFKASDACFCALYFFFYLRLEQTIGEANWLSPTGDVEGWLHRTAARRWYCLYQRKIITLKFMTAKGNIHNLETAFMWTVKSSNHLHSRILDFSSSPLILLVVSEMVWIFSSPWCFSIFSAFFFFVTWNFSMQLLSQKHTEKSFYFWTWSPYLGFIGSLQQLNVIQTFCTLNSLAFGLFISGVAAFASLQASPHSSSLQQLPSVIFTSLCWSVAWRMCKIWLLKSNRSSFRAEAKFCTENAKIFITTKNKIIWIFSKRAYEEVF